MYRYTFKKFYKAALHQTILIRQVLRMNLKGFHVWLELKYKILWIFEAIRVCSSIYSTHQSEKEQERSCRDILRVASMMPFQVPEDVLLDEWKLLQLEKYHATDNVKIILLVSPYLQKGLHCGYIFPNVGRVTKTSLTLSHEDTDLKQGFSVSKCALNRDKSAKIFKCNFDC